MALKASELTVGDSYEEEVCRDLSRTQIVQYAGTSGDYNPLHTDDKYTTEIAKYPSGVCPRHAINGHDWENADKLCW